MDPQHSAIMGFGGMVAQARDDGMRFVKDHWQILAVCASVLVAGGQTHEQITLMAKTIDRNSERLVALEAMAVRLETLANESAEQVREIRKDQRAGKTGIKR